MKDIFHIEGLGGAKTLTGSISVGGAKNAILPLMASALLFDGTVNYENVPEIEDVTRMASLLSGIGCTVKRGKGTLQIHAKGELSSLLPEDDAKRMRASVILTGPMLARIKDVSFPHPGGCVLGSRPIDFFLSGFKAMGATVEEGERSYRIRAEGGLHGADIFLPVPSVTATETFLLAGALALGETIIRNSALEPEVESLALFLKENNFAVSGIGTPILKIRGRAIAKSPKKPYVTIPDRIEAGSYLILGALAGDSVEVKDCNPEHLSMLIEVLRNSGVPLRIGPTSISIVGNGRIQNDAFKGFNIKTHEYPGFPTDLQAPIAVFLTQATGESLIHETIFEARLNYTADLVRMGADITNWDVHRALVKGPTKLRGRTLEGPDIRAGLAYIIAAAIAEGESVIKNVHLVDRGYENIEGKLSGIGLSIKRTTT